MEQSEINKYIDGFSTELKNFLIYIDELVPTETTQKILSLYDKINMMKIIKRYHGIMSPLKDKLSGHDASIFVQCMFIIPEFNMSFFWENLPNDKRNYVWEVLMRLTIYSNIIVDNQKSNVTPDAPKNEPKQKNKNTKEVNPFVGVGTDGTNISVDTLQGEIDAGKTDTNPMMNMLSNALNMDELSKQLKEVDKESISKMTDEVKKMIAPHVDDPQVSGMIGDMLTNISDELKNSDLSNGNLMGTMMKIAEKMSVKLSTEGKCSPEKLLASTQSLMKSIGLPENMNPTDILAKCDPSILSAVMSGMAKK